MDKPNAMDKINTPEKTNDKMIDTNMALENKDVKQDVKQKKMVWTEKEWDEAEKKGCVPLWSEINGVTLIIDGSPVYYRDFYISHLDIDALKAYDLIQDLENFPDVSVATASHVMGACLWETHWLPIIQSRDENEIRALFDKHCVSYEILIGREFGGDPAKQIKGVSWVKTKSDTVGKVTIYSAP